MKLTFRGTVGLVTVVGCVALGSAMASPALAANVTCGQTITQNVTLTANVGPCSGDGIIVGADGVTVDLGGHRLIGTGGDTVGIRLPNRSGVTVTGGQVDHFAAGVAIMRGSNNRVTNLTVRDNIGALTGEGDFGDGIVILSSKFNTVFNDKVIHNGPFDGIGVFGGVSAYGNQIVNSVVRDNNLLFHPAFNPDFFGSLDAGINLGEGNVGSTRTTIANNLVLRNGYTGILACSERGVPCVTTQNTIVGNRVELNGLSGAPGGGITIESIPPGPLDPSGLAPVIEDHSVIRANHVTNNYGNGIGVGSHNNQIINNNAAGNDFYDRLGNTGAQIFFDLEDASAPLGCDENVWKGNIYVTANRPCTTIDGRQVSPPPLPALTDFCSTSQRDRVGSVCELFIPASSGPSPAAVTASSSSSLVNASQAMPVLHRRSLSE